MSWIIKLVGLEDELNKFDEMINLFDKLYKMMDIMSLIRLISR